MELARDRAQPGHHRGRLARMRDRVMFCVVLGIFCVVSLVWSLLAGVLFRLLPRRAGGTLGRRVFMASCRAGLGLMRVSALARFDLAELDALRGQGAAIIACNHLSLIDAVLLISRLPDMVCISKAGLWNNPLLGGSVRLAGYIRNDAPLALIRAASRALG